MTCKTETTTIKGKDVSCTQWTASKGLEMQSMLLGTLGDYCLSFVMGDWDFKGLMYIVERADPLKLEKLVRACCYSSKVDGLQVTERNFDDVFSGDLSLLYETFSFVLQTNFKDFFIEGLTGKDQNPS